MRSTITTTVAAVAFAVAAVLGTSPVQAEKKISFLAWNIPHFKAGAEKWMKQFKAKYPDVTIEWLDKKGSEWSTYYQTQVVAGTAPDIVDVQGGLWLEYASKGGLLDLTPYLKADQASYTSELYPEFLSSWVYEGKNYGVPFYISKTLLFYNQAMFKKAGLSGPPKTFDDLLAYAGKLSGGEKSGFMTLNFDWLYWSLMAMNGVEMFTPDLKKAAFNTPAAVAAVEKLAAATKSGAINKISWTGRWVKPNNAFAAGTIGMLQAHSPAFMWMKAKGPWMNKDTVGVAQMPGNWSTPNSHALLISKSTKYPKIAWEFAKMATSGGGAYDLGSSLNVLTGSKVANKKLMAYFEKNIPDAVSVMKTQTEHLDKLVGNWPVAKDAAVKEAFYPELQNALLGRKSAKEALDAAEKKVNRVLSRR
ncbi:MAG: sugar ABC transporter substrate-binding protein [Rhodospirillales bacterium]|mgnify:FL=1|jgi:ABC-type glycerol-3-phosphate transport system substrate-binding protein|nr:sugar ABC transporter substrate-binding protein [Rhodospirillales bacterium]